MKKALISVTNKVGLVEFGEGLAGQGFEILSTGGTARVLKEAGVPVTEVADYTGFKEMMDGRVKTLHPKVHAGILGVRSNPEHSAAMTEHGISPIDIVVVNLYRFEEEVAKTGTTREQAIEQIDIGGPAMIRSAAKNHRFVTVVVDPNDYAGVLAELKAEGSVGEATRGRLASKAIYYTACYDLAIARYLSGGMYEGFVGELVRKLRYGENPHQVNAALYLDPTARAHPLAPDKFVLVGGDGPSYINETDLDRLLTTAMRIAVGMEWNFGETLYMALAVKHGNVCGVGVAGDDPISAVQKMVLSDPTSLSGGVVLLNFEVDDVVADFLRHADTETARVLDTVIAPAFTDEARQTLDRKNQKCRMFANEALRDLFSIGLDTSPQYRQVWGGFLKQDPNLFVLDIPNDWGAPLTERQQCDLVIAWAVGATANSNTIVLVHDGYLLGRGVAQPSRVLACKVALLHARENGHGDKLPECIAYSDSFFPFEDGPTVLAEAGVKTIFATSGSVRDAEVREACERLGVMLLQLPDKEARGFFAH